MARAAADASRNDWCRAARPVAVAVALAATALSPAAMAHTAFPYEDRADQYEMRAPINRKAAPRVGPRATVVPAIGLMMVGGFVASVLLMGWRDGWYAAERSNGARPNPDDVSPRV